MQVVACSPLHASQSILHSRSCHSLVEHSNPRRTASLTDHDHARKRKADNIEPQFVRTRKRHVLSEQDEFVCEACCQIDFQKVVNLDVVTLHMIRILDGIFIASLGTLCDQASGSNCALCRIFSAVRIPTDPHQNSQEYQLRAFSLQMNSHFIQARYCPKKIIQQDQPYLAVVPNTFNTKFIHLQPLLKKQADCSATRTVASNKESSHHRPSLVK